MAESKMASIRTVVRNKYANVMNKNYKDQADNVTEKTCIWLQNAG